MSDTKDLAVELNHITKKYGFQTPIKGIDMNVPKASIYALVGPASSGKTLLLQLIAGLVKPSSGEIYLSGLKESNLHHGRTGIYLKGTGLIPEYSVIHNFYTLANYMHLKDKTRQIREVLKIFGLSSYSIKLVSTLSPKAYSLAGIALAFLGWPDVVLLDDPFLELEADELAQLANIFNELKTQKNLSIIVSCQNAKPLDGIADCYGVLVDGKIEEEVLPDDIDVFTRKEVHLRTSEPKKAKKLLADQDPLIVEETWLILQNATMPASEVFQKLMSHKVDVYEITTKNLTKQDYFNRFSENKLYH